MILVKARINILDADKECGNSKFETSHFVIPYQQNGSQLQQNESQNQHVLSPLQQYALLFGQHDDDGDGDGDVRCVEGALLKSH